MEAMPRQAPPTIHNRGSDKDQQKVSGVAESTQYLTESHHAYLILNLAHVYDLQQLAWLESPHLQ